LGERGGRGAALPPFEGALEEGAPNPAREEQMGRESRRMKQRRRIGDIIMRLGWGGRVSN